MRGGCVAISMRGLEEQIEATEWELEVRYPRVPFASKRSRSASYDIEILLLRTIEEKVNRKFDA